MVNLCIKRLQQLVQQLPSEYTSTNRNEKSAMEATPDIKSSVEMRYCTRGRKKDKKGRRQRHRSRTPLTSSSRSPPRYRRKSRARSSISRKPEKRDINLTSCPNFKEFGGYGLVHASPKTCRMQNAITKISGRVGDPNGSTINRNHIQGEWRLQQMTVWGLGRGEEQQKTDNNN